MQGRFAKGMLFVQMNCADPAHDDDFNRWYNEVHVPDVIATGWVENGRRYRNLAADLREGESRYLALYETDRWDMEDMIDSFRTVDGPRWREQGHTTTYSQLVRMSVVRRCGPPFRPESSGFTTARTGTAPVSGLLLMLDICTEPAQEGNFNDWFNRHAIPELIATGPFHTAYRFACAVREPDGSRLFATLCETEAADPRAEVARFLEQWQPSSARPAFAQHQSTSVFAPIFAQVAEPAEEVAARVS
ncbi:MAG: DUF4286 family protein [Dehalococcoidia bacterium]